MHTRSGSHWRAQNLLVLIRMWADRARAEGGPRRGDVHDIATHAAVRGALLLGIPLAIHVALFAIHLDYLPNTGDGDGYLSPTFQATLVGNTHRQTIPPGQRPSFVGMVIEHAAAQVGRPRPPRAEPPPGRARSRRRWCAPPRGSCGTTGTWQ